MANKILNYTSICVFLTIAVIVLIYRMNDSCPDNKDVQNLEMSDEDEYFLDKYVYQNIPPNNYEYLVNYPDGPFSWGEWSWGSRNTNCKGNCNYAILYEKQPNSNLERGINL